VKILKIAFSLRERKVMWLHLYDSHLYVSFFSREILSVAFYRPAAFRIGELKLMFWRLSGFDLQPLHSDLRELDVSVNVESVVLAGQDD
jgi:hypothetical protein